MPRDTADVGPSRTGWPRASVVMPGTFPVPRWASRLGTVGLCVVVLASSLLNATYAVQGRIDADGKVDYAGLLLWLVAVCGGVGACVVLVFRRQYPVAACLVACVGAVALPVDAVGPLVALSWVIGTRPVRTCLWLGGLTAVASAAPLVRDVARPAEGTILSVTAEASGTGEAVAAHWGVYLAIWVVGLVLAGLMGWLRRTQTAVGAAQVATRRQESVSSSLRDEVARQEERELFAREVHDTLGHRLSLVSLHAGALEVAAPEGSDELVQAAQVVRLNAQQSIEDLRDLIAQLRYPQADVTTYGEASLVGLPDLLGRSKDAGVPLVATVLLGDVDRASPQLTRAVYRILQECLTNVHKHAPEMDAVVDLRGGAPGGISLRVSNALPPGRAPTGRAGMGLVGIGERARLLGGTTTWGVEDGRFVVSAHLPWSTVSVP